MWGALRLAPIIPERMQLLYMPMCGLLRLALIIDDVM